MSVWKGKLEKEKSELWKTDEEEEEEENDHSIQGARRWTKIKFPLGTHTKAHKHTKMQNTQFEEQVIFTKWGLVAHNNRLHTHVDDT